jgi:AcrR family transcriptional regulator
MMSTPTFPCSLTAVTEASARPYHHGNLRSALLAQAEQVVGEHGVDALSLRELARAVGVSHGAPRRHFADKQALLEALAVEGFGRLARELEAALEAARDAAFAARVEAVAGVYVRFATRQPALVDVMFAAKHRAPDAALQEAAGRAFATMHGLIAEGQATGELEPGDPQVFATALFAVLQGLVSMSNGGMLPADEIDATVADAIGRLLRGSRPAERSALGRK